MAAAWRSSLSSVLFLMLCYCGAVVAADQEVTHLHFYFHEVEVGAPNATVVNVASLHSNASALGDVDVFDNALREGPDPASRLIGRAQGFGVHASADDTWGLTAISFVFSDYGDYSGSTLAALGHLTVSLSRPAERSIVGGTGKFRIARGYMISKVLSFKGSSVVVAFDMYFTLAH